MDAITSLKEDYEQAWKQEWTNYRLGSALGRWDAEYEYWRSFQANMHDVTDRLKPGNPMPALESFGPKR